MKKTSLESLADVFSSATAAFLAKALALAYSGSNRASRSVTSEVEAALEAESELASVDS
jgi:hypothetical protein